MQVDQIERFRLLSFENLKHEPLGTARDLGVLLLQRLLLDNASAIINNLPDQPSSEEHLSGLNYIYCCFWLLIYLSKDPNQKPKLLEGSFPKIAGQPAYIAAADILELWLVWLERYAVRSGHSIAAETEDELRNQVDGYAMDVRTGIEALRRGPETLVKMIDGHVNYFSKAGVWAVGTGFALPMPIYVNIREEKQKPIRPHYNFNKDYRHCMPYQPAGIDLDSPIIHEYFDQRKI